ADAVKDVGSKRNPWRGNRGHTVHGRRLMKGKSVCNARHFRKCSSEQLVERDREITHAHARRVKDRVGDRRRDARHADLTDALRADRIDMLLMLVDKKYLDPGHVGMDRDVIL